MNPNHEPRPDQEMENHVSAWLTDTDPKPDEAQRGLERLLETFPTTPQARRRFLGRWFDRDEGARRRTDAHDHPPDTTRRNRLMLSATGLVAAFVVLAISINVVNTNDTSPPNAGTGATHMVSADGSGDFATISEAVAAAQDGDTIVVRPGTYAEAIVIDKDITLTGDGPRDEIVIMAVDENGPELNVEVVGFVETEPYGLWLTAPGATVSDLTVSTPRRAAGVLVTSGSPILERLTFNGIEVEKKSSYDGGYTAMIFTGDSSPTIRESHWDGYAAVRDGASATFDGNTITANTVSADGPGETSVRNNTFLDGGGVSMSLKVTGVVEGNEFADGGIGVDSASSVEVRGNTIDGATGSAAIYISGAGTHADVSGNTVTDAKNGVWLGHGAAATVEGNMLGASQVGITISRSDATIDGNTIEGEGAGIAIVSGGSPTITGNTIDVGGRGIAVGDRTSPTISGNVVCGGAESIHVWDGAEPQLGDNEICEVAPAG